ncbi:ABC transporter family protein [Cyclospora cayetanensis]|uniref:ABC transporter family protein n=1 Tax=Cyclospora cayetanensis TaxID=88456 RepID=A0A1D3DB12_9EIME|nr:ABC transporter family protein [Cyclospora cayetanensis]
MSTEHRLDFAKRSLPFPRRMYSHVSETTDRVCVLLWRAFALKLRYPLMTLIGIVAPGEPLQKAGKGCRSAGTKRWDDEWALHEVKALRGDRNNVLLSALLDVRYWVNPCFSPSNLMPPFGRRYDGLHLMYLPAILHSGGYLAFVDKAGSDCQQLRKFLGEFAQTVSPYLMERTLESQLFITFPSERALEKYRREAAAYKKRPIYSAFICRAAAPGGLDITIRMHVRRGTADTIGTEAQDKPYGHLTGGFLDLLTLVHTFNLDRTGVRKLFPGSIVPQQQKPQWLRISETFYKIFDYFGRIPVLNSINQPQDVRYLLPAFLAGPGYGAVRLYTHRAVQAGCDSEAPAMKVLESLFYSRTKKMGAGLILATGGPLHQVLRTFSSPVRTAYAPVMFMESGMPFTPATVTSRFGKPDSCCAPFVVLFVCILWQAVKAIMVDKETGFKNMLKILGISDKVLWLSWYIFFIIYSLPMLLLVAFVSKCYAFTLSDIWFLLTLLVLALMATISFALFVTAFFTDGNLAALGVVCFICYPGKLTVMILIYCLLNQPLLDVRGVCKTFSTWQAKKCSRGSLQAVNRVSFSVYRDEIFGVLGQNGAGKSTLISVITGSIAFTDGDVFIEGLSMKRQPTYARRNIGYCPQFDVLLPYLTVEETLWVYASLRGVPRSHRKEEIAELMNMMKLSEMAKVRIEALSGGWRRRVSSTVAFLGDPAVVFLDEPTAGMDTLYRRTFWDSVRCLSRSRCIVLTTHMMEEADYLCDRLAIMVDGRIASAGAPLILKTRFGRGYIISVISRKQGHREEQQAKKKLRQLLHTLEHPPAIQEISGHELRIFSPFHHSFQLPVLFAELEKNGEQYGVESAVLGFGSLEEVFLNVVKLARQEQERAAHSLGLVETTNPDGESLENAANTRESACSSPSCAIEPGSPLGAEASRSIGRLGTCDYFLFHPAYADGIDTLYASRPAMTHNNVSDKVKNNNEMYDFLLDGYTGPHLPRYGAYVVRGRQPDISDTANQLEVTLWHNATLRDAVPLHYSHLLNCIAQDRRGLPNSVFVSNQPFADTEDKFMDALIVAFFTIIAYSFVAAGIGKACIVERVRRVRHQQILFGVTPFHYWASSYLVDMILLLLPCFIIFGMIMWANITPLVGQHQRGIFLLGTILFCLSVCPFGYAISMGLDSPMTFVIVMLILGWSLPSLQVLFTEVSGLQGIYSKYLRYFLMFLPHAALCELLINLGMMNQLASGTMKAEELVNWMDFHKTGCPLLYLGLTVLLNWTVCISVDWITNYPMGKPRLARALPSIGTLFKHLAGLLHCQLCEGAPQTCSQACRVPEDVPKSTGQFTRRMSPTDEGYAFQGRVADISCNIKDEEARAARAVSRLRKSTTFNILSSLVCQSDGSVFISGWDTLIHPQKARTKLRYCPQTDPLLPTLTGAEHVYLYGSLLGLRGRELAQFCSDFFDVIGCKQYMHRLVNSYSGGTKRKLSLGIAMLGDAELLLLDEPTCGVDPESRQALWRMIEDAKNCKTAGKAIILTSHSMEECEVLSDKVGILHRGKLLCLGTSAELRAAYGHGYQIECVFVAADVAENPALPQCFVAALKKNLPTLRLVHRMAYKITVSIAKKEASLAAIFREIDTAKAAFALEAYAVSETTLEEVFVEVSHQADQNDNQA